MLKSLFKLVSRFLSKRNTYLIKSLVYDQKERYILDTSLDYVRFRTLELCCHEIREKKVRGSIAELGVYKGEFAKRLNRLFPERDLYLFDTFEGFDSRDLNQDKREFSTKDQDFSDTSEESVLGKMEHPEKCIVKKGYFPETTEDLDEKFALVSIDADLYEPILKGLEYFYPRLEKNGYIFIHDFTNSRYAGAREAVLKFCNEQNAGYVPIPDIGGSVILTR